MYVGRIIEFGHSGSKVAFPGPQIEHLGMGMRIVFCHQESARDTGRANKKIILRAVVWRVLVSVDPENWVGLSQCGGNVDYPLVKYVQLGNILDQKI